LDDPWHRIILVGLLLVLATMSAVDVVDGWWKRRRNNRSVCRGCGQRKPWAEFLDLGHEYCRTCGVMRCWSCAEVRPLAELAEGQAGGWLCRACSSTVCLTCRKRLPDKSFGDPALDPTCPDCEVRRLSDDERVALEREEHDFRRRWKEGHVPYTEEERREVSARRAALAGVSTRRYKEAEEGVGWWPLLLFPIAYLVSAVLVSIYAIAHGVHGGALWEAASPPELLPILFTILLLYVGWLFFGAWFDSDGFRGLELRWLLSDRDFFPALSLCALLLPVLIYVVVLIIEP